MSRLLFVDRVQRRRCAACQFLLMLAGVWTLIVLFVYFALR